MNKKLYVTRMIPIVIILICLPVFIGWLVSFNVADWLEADNDWIGFWGG